MIVSAAAVLLLLVGGLIYWNVSSTHADSALGAALDTYGAPLAPAGAPAESGRAHPIPGMCRLALAMAAIPLVVIGLYVQNVMGYGPLRSAISFIPFAFAMPIGGVVSSRLVTWLSPRVVVIVGGILLLSAVLCGSTLLHRGVPYFPNLVLPIVLGGIGLGLIGLPLSLALIASVGVDEIGPASAVAVMLRSLGGPLVLAVVQVAITTRTLHLGGTNGPVKAMDAVQLQALDHGYTYGLLWLAGVGVLLCGVALLINYTAQQVGLAQEVKETVDAEGQ